ncbi:hypothetical protein AB6C44_11685 [Vibrio splendidus]
MEDVNIFKSKLSDVSLNFTVYKQLFDNSDSVEVMNKFHPFIFGNYQKCLVDILYLELTKLIDPEGRSGNENLSFEFLISKVNNKFQSELLSDLSDLGELFKESNLKIYRNKLIAHNDAKTLRGDKVIELLITSDKLEIILNSSWSLLGKIEYYLGIEDCIYQTSAYIMLPSETCIEEFVEKIKNRI